MSLLYDITRERLEAGEEPDESTLQFLNLADPLAHRLFLLGYEQGRHEGIAEGVKIGVEETMSAYDEMTRRHIAQKIGQHHPPSA
jgi:hypothetical protein